MQTPVIIPVTIYNKSYATQTIKDTNPAPIILKDEIIPDAEYMPIETNQGIYRVHFPREIIYYGYDYATSIPNNRYRQLEFSSSSIYSSAFLNDGRFTAEFLYNVCESLKLKHDNKYSIIDACSNVGCNALWFCTVFKQVTCCELDKNEYKRLCNNLQNVYRFNNVEIFNTNCVDIINKSINTDIIFLDPPFGSRLYSLVDNLIMTLNDQDVCDIIANMLSQNKCRIVALKHPKNMMISKMLENYHTIQLYRKGKDGTLNDFYSLTLFGSTKDINIISSKYETRYNFN